MNTKFDNERDEDLFNLSTGAAYLDIAVATLRGVATMRQIKYRRVGKGRTTAMIFTRRNLDILRGQIDYPTRPFKPLFGNSFLAQARQAR